LETISSHITVDVASLVESCRKGDEAAFRQIYELYNKAMYNTCVRMLSNQEEAKDVLQDSFVAAFQNINSFKASASFGSWLKSIVINRCIDAIRKRKFDLLPLGEFIASEDQSITNESENFSVSDIHKALSQLADGYRVVLNLYLFENFSHKMIAEKLGVSEGTSKSQYARARKKLAEQMSKNKSKHAG